MSLSIDNPEAAKLARELAELEGKSQEDAVMDALRERLAKQNKFTHNNKEAKLQKLREISGRIAARPVLDPRTLEEILYNNEGLPE
jgi:antitoxin VapB